MKLSSVIIAFMALFLISCESNPGLSTIEPADSSTQGSYTNMLVIDNFMYVINKENLQTFDLEEVDNPKLIDEQFLGFNIESLLHYRGNLFIGSPQAMYIYELGINGVPRNQSVTSYSEFGADFCQRDPIAVKENYAFASLSSIEIGQCRDEDRNEIRVFDIENISRPELINTVAMESPRGITVDGDVLFICESDSGLKVMDISNPRELKQLYHFDGFKAFDVIAKDGLLVVVGPTKIYEYDYSDLGNMVYLSELDI